MSITPDSVQRPTRSVSTHLTVLIVDTNADMRLYVRRCLRRLRQPLGQVLDAADGHTALTLAREIDFDLIISDAQLPGLDGYALRRALAREAVPVLLLSDAFLAEESPDPTVLAKPFNAQTLCARLRDLIDPGESL